MKMSERKYFERILARVDKYLPPHTHVLDVGCREGADAELLWERKCRVTAIDIEAYPEEWRKKTRSTLTFKKASAEDLPFGRASFDAVWAKDALHHMQNPLQALRELLRVAKPGAPVIVVEANRYNPILYLHMTLMEGHEHFTRRQFKSMLQTTHSKYRYFMLESRCLPWNSPWVVNLLQLFENTLEAVKIFEPWLTYQVAIITSQDQVETARKI